MLRVEEARNVVLQHAPPRRVGRMALEDALGLVLARDVAAPEPLPSFARSGMDGYAMRSADTQGATRENPALLPLFGVIPAGHPMKETLPVGSCASIMTGGAIPDGADTVIRLEEVRVTPEGIRISREVLRGENVAPIGEDVAEGQVVLHAGHKIRPAEVNLLSAIGVSTVEVYLPPRVGVLSTGDELVPPGTALGHGQIRNSNGPGLRALVRSVGCIPVNLGTAQDEVGAIVEALQSAPECDLILTTGGVSVGDFDVVREALVVMGAQQLFWRVSIKPGTPVCAGVWGERPVIGLSGNPAAAITNFDLLVRPLLDTLCGRERIGLRETEAVLDQPVLRTNPLTRYLRARIHNGAHGELRADIDMSQRAGVLSSMVHANGYVVIPGHSSSLPAGAQVKVLLQDDAEVQIPVPVAVS